VKQSTVETRDIHEALNDYKIVNFEPLEHGERIVWLGVLIRNWAEPSMWP